MLIKVTNTTTNTTKVIGKHRIGYNKYALLTIEEVEKYGLVDSDGKAKTGLTLEKVFSKTDELLNSDATEATQATDITTLKTDVATLKTAVGGATSGLVKNVADLTTKVGAAASGEGETAIAATGLYKAVADVDTALDTHIATKVADAHPVA